MISGKTPIFATGGPKHDHVRQKSTFSLITKKILELQKRFNDLILRFRHAGSIYVIFKVIDLDLDLDPEITISLIFSLKSLKNTVFLQEIENYKRIMNIFSWWGTVVFGLSVI